MSRSSSAPGSGSNAPQPVAGIDLTQQAFGSKHRAADPPAVMPRKLRQCQQGREAVDHGLKCGAGCMVWMMRRARAHSACGTGADLSQMSPYAASFSGAMSFTRMISAGERFARSLNDWLTVQAVAPSTNIARSCNARRADTLTSSGLFDPY